jgi:hypothetical protein
MDVMYIEEVQPLQDIDTNFMIIFLWRIQNITTICIVNP